RRSVSQELPPRIARRCAGGGVVVMKPSRVWLAGTALAFAAWIGYLAYVAWGAEKIHLSHPQIQYAEVIVIGHIKDKAGPVKIGEVVYSTNPDEFKPGEEVQVWNLRDSLHKWLNDGGGAEWDVPNDFIIPLRSVSRKDKDGPLAAEVVPLPSSPGLPHG